MAVFGWFAISDKNFFYFEKLTKCLTDWNKFKITLENTQIFLFVFYTFGFNKPLQLIHTKNIDIC